MKKVDIEISQDGFEKISKNFLWKLKKIIWEKPKGGETNSKK